MSVMNVLSTCNKKNFHLLKKSKASMMIDLTTGIKVVAVVDTQEEAITTEAAGPRAAGGPEGVVEETEGVVNKITEHPETVTLEEMTILETEKDSKKGIHYISKLY